MICVHNTVTGRRHNRTSHTTYPAEDDDTYTRFFVRPLTPKREPISHLQLEHAWRSNPATLILYRNETLNPKPLPLNLGSRLRLDHAWRSNAPRSVGSHRGSLGRVALFPRLCHRRTHRLLVLEGRRLSQGAINITLASLHAVREQIGVISGRNRWYIGVISVHLGWPFPSDCLSSQKRTDRLSRPSSLTPSPVQT